uniref:F-box domain-containing protein n=1 Tax=Panagrellus redivivus TaxID=6233 RepID=A0A7E4URL5_PANRE
MPYPILTLPYPFARRLHQLLSPDELENLQTAAGPDISQLKPIAQSLKMDYASFTLSDFNVVTLTISNYNDVVTMASCNPLIVKCKHLYVQCLNADIFKKCNFMTKLYLTAEQLHIDRCTVDMKLLTAIASIVNGVKRFETVNVENDVKLAGIFELFPRITNIFMPHAYKGWLGDLLRQNVTGLMELSVKHTDFDELFSFRSEELYQFVQNQSPEFKFEILLITPKNPIQTVIMDQSDIGNCILPLINPHFDIVEGENCKVKLAFGNDSDLETWRLLQKSM